MFEGFITIRHKEALYEIMRCVRKYSFRYKLFEIHFRAALHKKNIYQNGTAPHIVVNDHGFYKILYILWPALLSLCMSTLNSLEMIVAIKYSLTPN